MALRKSNAPLSVVLNGRDIGILTKAASGAIGFRYASTWLEEKNAIPVSLTLPLREEAILASRWSLCSRTYSPTTSRRAKARRPLRCGGTDAFSLLSTIGRDCVGALRFPREGDARGDPGVITGDDE